MYDLAATMSQGGLANGVLGPHSPVKKEAVAREIIFTHFYPSATPHSMSAPFFSFCLFRFAFAVFSWLLEEYLGIFFEGDSLLLLVLDGFRSKDL